MNCDYQHKQDCMFVKTCKTTYIWPSVPWMQNPQIQRANYTILFYFIFCFLGLHLWHMEVPRLGVQLELQPLAYATAIANQDLKCVCDLHISRQRQILNPLSEARDGTCNLMVTSRIHFRCATTGTPPIQCYFM